MLPSPCTGAGPWSGCPTWLAWTPQTRPSPRSGAPPGSVQVRVEPGLRDRDRHRLGPSSWIEGRASVTHRPDDFHRTVSVRVMSTMPPSISFSPHALLILESRLKEPCGGSSGPSSRGGLHPTLRPLLPSGTPGVPGWCCSIRKRPGRSAYGLVGRGLRRRPGGGGRSDVRNRESDGACFQWDSVLRSSPVSNVLKGEEKETEDAPE
jgi:hypothetical protein